MPYSIPFEVLIPLDTEFVDMLTCVLAQLCRQAHGRATRVPVRGVIFALSHGCVLIRLHFYVCPGGWVLPFLDTVFLLSWRPVAQTLLELARAPDAIFRRRWQGHSFSLHGTPRQGVLLPQPLVVCRVFLCSLQSRKSVRRHHSSSSMRGVSNC